MLIVCPNCATSYDVAAASMPEGGRTVRCARCKEIWFATAEQESPVPAMAGADDDGWGEALAEASTGRAEPPAPPAAAEPAADAADDADWAAALSEQDVDIPVADPAEDAVDVSTEMPSEEAPPLVPDAPAEAVAAVPAEKPTEDVESAARRLERKSWRWRFNVILPVLALALAALNASVLIWRAEVVRALPQTASLFAALGLPVNLRGLEFSNVTVTRDQHEGVSVLVVEGLILSVAKTPVEVPRLRLSIRNDGGAEIYTWTTLPTRNILGAGEQLPFRSRLASPPADGRDVQVRFFNRQDLATAAR